MQKDLKGGAVAKIIKELIRELIDEYELKPKMLLIQVGEDSASSYYVKSIIKNAEKLGCEAELVTLSKDISQAELISFIEKANQDPDVYGIMLQKPLPKGIDDSAVNLSINPNKDIDALNPINLGHILMEKELYVPCTPQAVYFTMRYYGIDPKGKNLVILGRSNVVGKPLANMLLWKRDGANATVTICHSRTENLKDICANADILISAIGSAKFVKEDMIKKDAIIIDVGINQIIGDDGELVYVGDVDFNACYDKALAITPVPGGIGKITTSVLYLHLVKAALIAKNINKNVDELIDMILSENNRK